jgi:hypothetical protein
MSGSARAGLFIFAKDIDCLAAFYELIAGMTRLHQTDELTVLESPDIKLLIHLSRLILPLVSQSNHHPSVARTPHSNFSSQSQALLR